MESAKVFGWFSPYRLDAAYASSALALPQQPQQVFERGLLSLRYDFNVAIALIACEAAQAKRRSFLNDKVAESHTLYAPTHRCMKFLYIVCVALFLVHGPMIA
jgi:hypothetical protein